MASRTPESDSPRVRVIKRYANRKLYDSETRRYVTLDGVAALVARGDEVEVRDQTSGEDLTNLVLAQALLEGIRQRTTRIPRQVLTRLIRLAGGPPSEWGEWPAPGETAGRAGHEAERIAGRFLASGRPGLDDAVALREEITQLVQRLVDEAQSGVEARLRALLALGEGAAGRSIGALRSHLPLFEDKAPAPPPPRDKGPRGRSRRGRTKK